MDHYQTLGVPKTASASEIKKAYRKLALENHPDRGGSLDKIKEINNAYAVLGDEDKRKEYDNPTQPQGINMHDFFNFGHTGPNNNKQQKIPIIEIHHEMTLEEIFTGMTVTKEYERDDTCTTCNESGYEDGVSRDCSSCNGSGFVTRLAQIAPGMLQQLRQQCTSCPKFPKCKTCNGNKYIKVTNSITVNIPKSVKNNKVIMIDNVGNKSGDMRGSVVVIIHEKEHATYKRNFKLNNKNTTPLDLLIQIDITLCESLCGFKKELTYLDKTKIQFYEENIIQNNSVKVLIGKGLEHHKKEYKKGNIYIEYNIQYPTKIEYKQKKLIYYALTNQAMEDIHIEHEIIPKDIDEINTDYQEEVEQQHFFNGMPHMHQNVQCAHQ